MNKIPTSVKILLGAMIGAAALIVAAFFINVKGITGLGANIAEIIKESAERNSSDGSKATEDKITKGDIDKDGLFDEEEPIYGTDPLNPDTDGDGFLDGEEVASGRKPWLPGPNDSVGADKNTNITEKLGSLITAGLFAGDLKKGSDPLTLNKAIDNLSFAVIYDSALALTPDGIEGQNKIVADNKQNQEKYLNALVGLIERELMLGLFSEPFEIKRLFSNFDFEEPQNNPEIKEYFNARSVLMERVIFKLETMEIPQSWEQIHKQTVSFLQTLELHYTSLANLDKDPVKSLVALNNIQDLYNNIRPLLSSIAKKINSENLSISSNEFLKLLNDLYNP